MKRYTGLILRLVVSAALLIALFLIIDRDALIQSLRSVRVDLYLIAFGFFMASVVLWTLRWWLFLRATGEAVSYWRAFRLLLIGHFYSMFLPTIVGSDVGRMYELGRDENNSRRNVISTVMLERLIGLISLALMAVLALILGYQYIADAAVRWIVIGTAAALVSGWILFFNQRLMEWVFSWVFRLPVVGRFETKIRGLYEVLYYLRARPRLLLLSGIVSLGNNVTAVLAVMYAAFALGVDIDPLFFYVFMPVIWLLTLIPISINGLGLREGGFAFFFVQIGVTSADAVAISLLSYSLHLIAGVLGGFILLHSSARQTWLHLRHQHS